MVKVVFISNPFQPRKGRVVKISEATGKPLSFYISEFVEQLPEKKAFVQMNGRQTVVEIGVTDPVIVNAIVPDNSFIMVMPAVEKGGGKSILGLVASIALSVVSMGVGSMVAGGAFAGSGAIAMGAWKLTSFLAAAAVMFVGGQLISKLGPNPTATKYHNEDPTYSWNGVTTMEGQGNAIAITYGTVKSGGQSIVKFVSNNGDDQYYNWLISAGEGPLEIRDIKLNNNPIGNYENCKYEIRTGTNDQSVIANFNDTIQSKTFNYELDNNEWRVDVTDGNSAEGLIVDLECSNGLYHANNNGSLGNAWIDVRAEYALDGTENWKLLSASRITGKKAGPVRKQLRVDNIPVGKYKVRVKVTGRSADVSSSRDAVRIWWNTLSTIIYEDSVYPNTALIGMKIKATSQLSGSSPQLTFIKTRSHVWVWNPIASAYEQKPATNPAWAAYDFLHGAQRLKDINTNTFVFEEQGVPKELMMYDQFKEWADNCDRLNLEINIEITQEADFWSIINKEIAPVGRGQVVQFGTRFGCVFDHKSEPVQLFNMGNIMQGSFQLSYMSVDERANMVEITYICKDKDYEKDTLVVYGNTYDTDDLQNPTQITMNGITSYEQAYREAKYQLMCNQLIEETVSFKADVEAIGCMVGDLILVAHDVPYWSLSGRISEYGTDEAGINYVVLPLNPADIDTSLEWNLMIRTQDNSLVTYDVQSISGELNAVKVDIVGGFSKPPTMLDPFALGVVNAVAKPFIVKSITRDTDLVRNISAVQYVEGVFDENYTIPEPDYSLVTDGTIVNVTNLKAHQIAYKNKVGNALARIYVSWSFPEKENVDYFTILLSKDGGLTYSVEGSTANLNFECETQAFTTYFVKVVTVWRTKQSNGTICGPVIEGIDEPPPNVTALDVEITKNGTRRYYCNFNYPDPNDIAGFRMKYVQGTSPSWHTAFEIQDGLITNFPYETYTVRQGPHTVMIKAVDNAGQESPNFASCIVNFDEPLEDNVMFKKDFSDWEDCETTGSIMSDGYIHSAQDTAAWTAPNAPAWTAPDDPAWGAASYRAFYLTASLSAPASGYFWITYDVEGPVNITYKVQNTDNLWKPYATKFKVRAGDVIDIKFEASTGNVETVLKSLVAIIDVPDREEHFENIYIPADGLELPIQTPNYYTTAVRVDSFANNLDGKYEKVIESLNPCVVRFYRINNDAGWSKDPVDVIADITWQGFEREVI